MFETTKLIIFDFDGTLVDSNAIKLSAFDRCFSEFTGAHPEILAYCHSNHHTPRWEKFRHVVEKILKRPYTPEMERDLHKRYEEATTSAVIAAPEIPGASAFLKNVTASLPTALLSTTPHEVLIHILDERGWRKHFRYVQGAPMKKSDWIRALRERLGLSKEHIVFLGDSVEDSLSAAEADCPFIAVANPALADKGFPFLKDFREVKVAA